MGQRAGFPRPAGRRQPHPRTHFHRAGNLPGLPTGGLARAGDGGSLFHPAGHADRHGTGLGIRAVRLHSARRRTILRHPSGGDRHRSPGIMEPGWESGKKLADRSAGIPGRSAVLFGGEHPAPAARRRAGRHARGKPFQDKAPARDRVLAAACRGRPGGRFHSLQPAGTYSWTS